MGVGVVDTQVGIVRPRICARALGRQDRATAEVVANRVVAGNATSKVLKAGQYSLAVAILVVLPVAARRTTRKGAGMD